VRITAVVPCHNHELWVADCLRSLARQKHDMNVILVDDGSTDSSKEAALSSLQEYDHETNTGRLSEGKPFWYMRREKAGGPSAARNMGINWGLRLGTDVFAFLDSDDMYEDQKIEKSIAQFKRNKGVVGVVYSDYENLYPEGYRIRRYKESYSREKLLRDCIVNCDSLVSAAALEKCGLFDETLRTCEDYDLWLRISEHFMLIHIPEPLVTIRCGDHSSTATVPSETWQRCYARVFEKVRERL
jgi:glycosyltransferase involved in cell wall biosynthesis